jgi:PAS domain S-box-containing protein
MADTRTELAKKALRMMEAEETLQAIRRGAVDAFVIEEPEGHRVFALQGADLPYSILVERMQQGATMLDARGEIIYCNPSLVRLLGGTRETLIGLPLEKFVDVRHQQLFRQLLQQADSGSSEGEMQLLQAHGVAIPANFSFRLLCRDKSAIGVLITDLTTQKQQAEFMLRLQQLTVRLQQMQDEERRRFARELHDSVGQLIVSIGMNIARVQTEAHKLSPEIAELINENEAMIKEINDQIRTISHLLHPPLLDEVGLPSAVRWYINGFAERSKIQTTVDIAEDFERLPRETEIAAFRAVQECLTNVHRHSGSSSCSVKLGRNDGQLVIQIRDAGRGIPVSKLVNLTSFGGVGLRGMEERLRQLGGTLTIDSNECGTTITAILPLPSVETTAADENVA